MRRRAVARSAMRGTPLKAEAAIKAMAGKSHFHACVGLGDDECRLVYECRCAEPLVNGRCHEHRARRRPVWDSGRDPRPCCVGAEHVTDTATITAHDLAGPGPWFRCPTCARCFGHRPINLNPRFTRTPVPHPQERHE